VRFVYSLIRFVPDPARGEFINVGAIVGSEETSEWQVRQIENPVRARFIDEHGTLRAVWDFIDRVGRNIDEFEEAADTFFRPSVELSEAWLNKLHVEHRNIVQLSPPIPMIASNANEALDRVFQRQILDPARQRYGYQRKHPALAAVRNAYRKHHIAEEYVKTRVTLHTPRYSEMLDFAVADGEAVQLTQTWSFQVPDQELLAARIKAWGWTIQDVQHSGGKLDLGNGDEAVVDPKVNVGVVYVPPMQGQDAPALQDATNVFKALNATYFELDKADRLAAKAQELLGMASSSGMKR